MAVLMQGHGLHVDSREGLIDGPRITLARSPRRAEVVVVVNLIQGCVEVLVIVDVRGIA